jgi:hypothetical protein
MRNISNLGTPFMDVRVDSFIPQDEEEQEYWDKYKEDPPVFSEMFLYSRVGKGDARFILAIAEEYSKLIEILGRERILEIFYEAHEIDKNRYYGFKLMLESRSRKEKMKND